MENIKKTESLTNLIGIFGIQLYEELGEMVYVGLYSLSHCTI